MKIEGISQSPKLNTKWNIWKMSKGRRETFGPISHAVIIIQLHWSGKKLIGLFQNKCHVGGTTQALLVHKGRAELVR